MEDKKRKTLRLPDELYGALKGKAWVEIPNSISFKIFRTTFYLYFIGFNVPAMILDILKQAGDWIL